MILDRITIVIADQIEIMRVGLAWRLEKKYPNARIYLAKDGPEVLEYLRTYPVNLLILDLSLKAPSSFELIRTVRQCWRSICILTQFADEAGRDGLRALRLGVNGAIARSAPGCAFETAAQTILCGHTFCPTNMIAEMIEMHPNQAKADNFYGLTKREIEVVRATAKLQSTRAVGEFLGISTRTVESHRHSIYRKTGCENLDDLVALANQFDPAQA